MSQHDLAGQDGVVVGDVMLGIAIENPKGFC
jgi:hypothetical protein